LEPIAHTHGIFGEWGDACPYYIQVFTIWTLMDTTPMVLKRDKFTRYTCKSIAWAILEGGCKFFAQVVLPEAFKPGGWVGH